MRSSGAKGWPFTMPMEAKRPTVSGSTQSAGSACTVWFSSSQKEKSFALIVLNCMPEVLTKVAFGASPVSVVAWSGCRFVPCLHVVDRGLDVAVLHEGAEEEEERVGGGLLDEVALRRDVASVARRHEEVAAALAGIGACEAHVVHPAEVRVVHRAEDARGHGRGPWARR